MTVYLSMLTFICFLAALSLFMPKKLRLMQHGISLVGYSSTCIFIGLRDHVGADWDSYIAIFKTISQQSLKHIFIVEPLYAACNKLVYLAGGDIHIVNLICATIMLACLFNFSRLVGINSSLMLLVAAPYLLFVVGMGYTRQSVAIGLGLNAIGYLRWDRERMFYIFASLAILFHYSAIVLLLLWWTKNSRRLAVVAIGLILTSPLLLLVILSDRYVRYFNNDPTMQSHGVWSRILLILFSLLVIFMQRHKWESESQLSKMLSRGAIGLVVLTIISIFLSTLADRISLYLFFIYILGIGSLIRYSHRVFQYLSLFFVVGVSYAVFLVWFGLSAFAAAAWFPYRNALYGAN